MMEGPVKLNLLSFKKRENTTNYEPKLSRFCGKLCNRCHTLYSDKIAFDEHQLMCVAIDNIQQTIEVEESSNQGTETILCSMPTLSEIGEVDNEIEIYRSADPKIKCEMIGEVDNEIEIYRTTEPKIKCEMCPERFPSVWECSDHLKNVHLGFKKRSTQMKIKRESGGSSLVCDVCGRISKSRRFHEEHMRIHTGEKPFQCGHCGRTFRLEVLLQSHERTHTGERPYKCQICSKAFAQKSGEYRHMKAVHLGEKPYECDHCQKRFGQKVGMQQHVQTVHLKQPWKYLSKSRLIRRLRKEAAHAKKDEPKEQVDYDYDSDY